MENHFYLKERLAERLQHQADVFRMTKVGLSPQGKQQIEFGQYFKFNNTFQ